MDIEATCLCNLHCPFRTTSYEPIGGKVEIEFRPPAEDSCYGAHYTITPYSLVLEIGRKLISHYYVDMGQDLLEYLHKISKEANKNE